MVLNNSLSHKSGEKNFWVWTWLGKLGIINKNSLCFLFDHFQLFNMNAGLEAPLYGNKRCWRKLRRGWRLLQLRMPSKVLVDSSTRCLQPRPAWRAASFQKMILTWVWILNQSDSSQTCPYRCIIPTQKLYARPLPSYCSCLLNGPGISRHSWVYLSGIR